MRLTNLDLHSISNRIDRIEYLLSNPELSEYTRVQLGMELDQLHDDLYESYQSVMMFERHLKLVK